MKELLPQEELTRLETEFGVLHLIYHRNFNQHHVSRWWRDLNMLHRNTRKILLKAHQIDSERKHLAKQRAHDEAVQIAQYMEKKRIFSACYYSFNSLLYLTPFLSLGLTLIAITGAIRTIVCSILENNIEAATKSTEEQVAPPLPVMDEEDMGMELDPGAVSLPITPVNPQEARLERHAELTEPKLGVDREDKLSKPKKVKKPKKDKPAKKKRNAIDDIFG